MAAIQLPTDDLVPAVPHRPVRTGQAEDEDPVDDPRGGPRLKGRQADGLVADRVEDHREAVDPLVEQGLQRLGRHVTAGQARAPGRDDGVRLSGRDPALDLGADGLDVVRHEGFTAAGMACVLDPAHQDGAGGVAVLVAGVRHRQDCDPDRPDRLVQQLAAGRGQDIVGHRRQVSQRAASAWSRSVASIQRDPAGPVSCFQKGARVFNWSIR